MTLHEFWRGAPGESRVALVCAAVGAFVYPATFLGVTLRGGWGWLTIVQFVLVLVGMASVASRRVIRRSVWRSIGDPMEHGIAHGLNELRPPSRPRVLKWTMFLAIVALFAGFTEVAVRDERARDGANAGATPVTDGAGGPAEMRLFAACWVVFGIMIAFDAESTRRQVAYLDAATRNDRSA
jgi:hypothetical protein